MSLQNESLGIYSRPGDNTGVGTLNAQLDKDGVVAYAPTRHKQDSVVLHERKIFSIQVLAAAVDNHIFFCTTGVWRVATATYLSQVAGTGGAATVDVVVAGAGVAPSAGVTQLDAALNLETAAQVLDRSVIIASPTEIGPGSSLALNYTGTLTSVVGCLTIEIERIR